MSGKKRNAFDRMMSPSKKSRVHDRIVTCPSCASKVLEHLINSHLDSCVTPLSTTTKALGDKTDSPMVTPVVNDETQNVFSLMMQQSKRLSHTQYFHLNSNFSLSWNISPSDNIQWSNSIKLGKKKDQTTLILSTSIPEGPPDPSLPLVKRHSRLSIPVLKSILQKSVRRRRPLPATRVAMELVDRALGPFLRRLPIIMLEDSTLHPALPLLCWLMAAESKNYRVPVELISRVLSIVYEVSSCPWTDYLTDGVASTSSEEISPDLASTISPDCDVILKSMKMRVGYGGMKGDMVMVEKFHSKWKRRFHVGAVPPDVCQRVGAPPRTSSWDNIPSLIHSKAQHQGFQHVKCLMKDRLDRLEFKDICIEGIDFHCSDVLDQLINDVSYSSTCYAQLSQQGLIATMDDLLGILKRCMWNFSSGINFRQSLFGDAKPEQDERLKLFWCERVAPRVRDFMTNFVESRLVH